MIESQDGPDRSHVADGRLNALLDGELDGAESAAVLAHLAACEACGRRFAEAKRFLELGADVLGESAAGGPASAGAPPLPVEPAVGPPPRRPSRTAKEVALDLDGVTAKSPAIRPNVEEAPPLFRSRPAPRRINAAALAWAATIALAVAVGWLGSEIVHARATVRLAPQAPAGARAAAPQAAPTTHAPSPTAPTAPTATPGPASLRTRPPEPTSPIGRKRFGAPPPARADTAPAFRRSTLEQAVARLHGAIRLMDGFRSTGVEIGPGTLVEGASPDHEVIRVLYRSGPRRIALDEQRVGAAAGAGREPAPAAGDRDTLLTTSPGGQNTMRWVDQRGFWLALTARLPADSLRRLAGRVR